MSDVLSRQFSEKVRVVELYEGVAVVHQRAEIGTAIIDSPAATVRGNARLLP